MTRINYTIIHLHSDYSLLDSCTQFADYIEFAKQNGMTAIASTEHGLTRGWIEKKVLCDEAGIKFIHGVEMYLTEDLANPVRDNYHTVLLAKNMDGVRELNSLVSLSSREDHFYYVNRISFDEFLGISDNVIKTSACLAGPLHKLDFSNPYFMRLLQHYDYLEVQPHIAEEQKEYNKKLLELSKQYGIPLIAGTDTHSLNTYKAECRTILTIAKHKHYDDDGFDLTAKTYDELVELFRQQGVLPEEAYLQAIENTNRVAEQCENWELDKKTKYPILYGSAEADEEKFRQVVWDGLEDKLQRGVIPREQEAAFRASLMEELEVFHKLGMSGFMLSMSELIRWCKEHDIAVGPARGSVGGSRCAYVSDIIDLDPEQWHTVFSRFCNVNRKETGDIDVDVTAEDRPRIFEYIIQRFGTEKTARVASYGTLVEKSAMDDIGRALAELIKNGERDPRFKDKCQYTLEDVKKIKQEFSSDEKKAREKYPWLFYYYDGIIGTKISQSVHPAGMVISPVTLDDNYGVFIKDGERCLTLSMGDAHSVELVKYDFLILKTVNVIRDACQYAGIPYPKSYQVNFDDQEVWTDMMRSPVGIFQFESVSSFAGLKQFEPHNMFDMSLVTAAIRPSGASYRKELLAHQVHHNPSELIDKLLENNIGYLVYQEDIIAFLQQICGLSGSDADEVRRGIARKKPEVLEKALPSILEGYCSKSDKPREAAEAEAREFIQIIEDASSYMFGYNHSIAYCLLGFYCAMMRYYHPIEFITSYLNNAANDEDVQSGTKLASIYKIKVTSPKYGISRNDYYFDREKREISKGLGSIKFMSEKASAELFSLYDNHYDCFVDLLKDLADKTSLNARQLAILVKIDFFSDFGNQRELLRIIELFDRLNSGGAKEVFREAIDGSAFEQAFRRHSTWKTKSGKEAKKYKFSDCMAILRECEAIIKQPGIEDLDNIVKVMNYYEATGTFGYYTGLDEDRPKLFVKEVYPVCRKSDNKQFGYSIITQSLGSGKESRFTVFNRVFDKDPIQKNDLILCKHYAKDGPYFQLDSYTHIY